MNAYEQIALEPSRLKEKEEDVNPLCLLICQMLPHTSVESSICAVVIHSRQLLSSPLELDYRQMQRDELDTHDCVRRLEELVNVVETLVLLRKSLVTALNPQLSAKIINSDKGDT